MKQKSTLGWVKFISEDHRGLEMAFEQRLGSQHKRKTEKF